MGSGRFRGGLQVNSPFTSNLTKIVILRPSSKYQLPIMNCIIAKSVQ